VFVWLPIFADWTLGGGPELYGVVLDFLALGGVMAGLLLTLVGLPALITLSASLIGVPGLLGYRVRALRAE
jgi:hypothetical protein